MKSIDSMSPDELFAEAGRIRKQIVTSAERLHKVCDLMYNHVRRHPSELTSTFVNISNAGKRFAGSVVQGAKRTEAVDRILEVNRKTIRFAKEQEAKRRAEVEQRNEERKLKRLSNTDVYGLFTSSNEDGLIEHMITQGDVSSDLNELYGEE